MSCGTWGAEELCWGRLEDRVQTLVSGGRWGAGREGRLELGGQANLVMDFSYHIPFCVV